MIGKLGPLPGQRIDWSSPFSRGLLAAYAFNEGAGSRLACGVRPSQSGTISGATWVKTEYGPALDFAAGTNAVTCLQQGRLQGMARLTVVAVAQIDAAGGGGFGRLVTLWDASSFAILTDGGPSSSIQSSTNGSTFNSGTAPGTGWRHLTLTYDGATRRIYFDGVLQASSAGTGTIASLSTQDLVIGNRAAGDRGWDGRIKQLLVYNRDMTAGEVARIAQDWWLPWEERRFRFYLGGVSSTGGVIATLSATLGDVSLSSSVTSAAPGNSAATLSGTLGAVTLTGSAASAAPGNAAGTLSATIADATLTSSVTAAAPGNAAATLTATLADTSLTSSVTASAAGTVAATLAQTVADATLTSAVVRTLPGNTIADLGGAGDQINETFGGTLADWTEHPNFTSGAFAITSAGRLRTNANGVISTIYHNTVPNSADQEVRATFRPVSLVASDQLQILLRADTTATTWYELGHVVGTGWLIRRRVNGTLSTIAAGNGATLTVGQDYAVVAKATGTTLELIVDGVTIHSQTDSNISAAGRVGVRGVQTTTSDAVGLHLDDFRLIGSGTPVVLDAVTLASSVTIAAPSATATLAATLDAATLAGVATAGTPAGATATLAATLDAVGLVSVVAAALTEGPTQITTTLTPSGADSSTLTQVGASRTVIVQAGPASTTFGAA